MSIYARQNPNPPEAAVRSLDALRTDLPGQRRYLTGEEFNSVYGADPADLAKIAAWAKANQLDVVESSAPTRRVQVEGTIQNVERAFSLELNEYQHPQDGQYRGREGEIHVPSELFGIVDGVFGLDTRRVGRPRRRNTGRSVWLDSASLQNKLSNPFPGSFFPPEVAQLIQLSRQPGRLETEHRDIRLQRRRQSGSSRRLQPSGAGDLFREGPGRKTPTITDVVVQGPGNDPGPDTEASDQQGDSTGEVMLDMCVVGSVAAGRQHFYVFHRIYEPGLAGRVAPRLSPTTIRFPSSPSATAIRKTILKARGRGWACAW